MKTIKEIAADCGLDSHSLRPSTLEKIVNDIYTGSTLYEESLYEIIGALYRRIEKLEGYEAGYRATLSKILLWLDDLGYGNSSLSIADNILQTLGEQRERIEKLEEQKECYIAEIKALESAVAGNASRIAKLEEEAYRDEWNCPSCGGESEDDDDARRCHPCGLRFPPAEEAP